LKLSSEAWFTAGMPAYADDMVAGSEYTYMTKAVTDGRPLERKHAGVLLRKIAEGTHFCGDPGMQFDDTINDLHPDVEEFIDAMSREERKARALIEQGYDASYNGEAYGSIMYQNENLTVRVRDEFMAKAEGWLRRGMPEVEGDAAPLYWTTRVTDGQPCEEKHAGHLLKKMAEGVHVCGDPGIQFDDTINAWHTCPGTDRQHFCPATACVTAETRIATDRGHEPIEDAYTRQQRGEGIVILTDIHSEQDHRRLLAFRPATIIAAGLKETSELVTADGRRLRATDNQHFLTTRGWVKLTDLKASDRLLLRESGRPVTPLSMVEARRWHLLGYMCGDGVFSRNTVSVNFSGPKQQAMRWMHEEFEQLKKDAYAHFEDQGFRPSTPSYGINDRQYDLSSQGKALIRYLEECYGLRQGTGPQKSVARCVFTAGTGAIAAYLQGLFFADGCIRAGDGLESEVMLATSSPELARNVQLLLNDLGIGCRISWSHPQGRKNPQGQIHITNQQQRKFHAFIGFRAGTHQAASQRTLRSAFVAAAKEIRPVKVVSIRSAGTQKVYDVCEPVTHSFVAEGLIVHDWTPASSETYLVRGAGIQARMPDGVDDSPGRSMPDIVGGLL
jgi:ribonucleoside-diphosphate reductase alpha chain